MELEPLLIEELNECVAGTLRWCNDRRLDKGLNPLNDLPKGSRSDPLSCPCGKATGLWVGMNSWGDDQKAARQTRHQLPPEVRQFVVYFDNGYIPQYDEEEEE